MLFCNRSSIKEENKLKEKGTKKMPLEGNRTSVSRVTGGDTDHYTIEEDGRYSYAIGQVSKKKTS